MVASCQSDNYYIRGEAWWLKDGTKLYLNTTLNTNGQPTDSTMVIAGHFLLQGTTDSSCISRLSIADDEQPAIIFFTEPGNIYIELAPEQGCSRVSGTEVNNRWQALNDSVALCDQSIRQLMSSAHDSVNISHLSTSMQQLYDGITRLISLTAAENRDNALGRFICTHYQGL